MSKFLEYFGFVPPEVNGGKKRMNENDRDYNVRDVSSVSGVMDATGASYGHSGEAEPDLRFEPVHDAADAPSVQPVGAPYSARVPDEPVVPVDYGEPVESYEPEGPVGPEGYYGAGAPGDSYEPEGPVEPEVSYGAERPVEPGGSYGPIEAPPETEQPVYQPVSVDEQTGSSQRSLTVISEDTYIDGNIMTHGNIEVDGGISGDVVAKGIVNIRGAVRGDISGESLRLYGCTVQGNMRASAILLIDSASMAIGNVRAKNIYLDGKLKGNIESEKASLLKSNAYYVGDITTSSIAIEDGAVVNGNIKTLNEDNKEDPFKPNFMPGMP